MGYFEIHYDEKIQNIIFKPVEMTQLFRFYEFENP